MTPGTSPLAALLAQRPELAHMWSPPPGTPRRRRRSLRTAVLTHLRPRQNRPDVTALRASLRRAERSHRRGDAVAGLFLTAERAAARAGEAFTRGEQQADHADRQSCASVPATTPRLRLHPLAPAQAATTGQPPPRPPAPMLDMLTSALQQSPSAPGALAVVCEA